MNSHFEHATGDVFAYLNADDALLPGAVRQAVTYLAANETTLMSYTATAFLVDSDGTSSGRSTSSPFNLRRYSHGRVTVLQPATFIRRSAFEQVGGFKRQEPSLVDGELIVRVPALDGGDIETYPAQMGSMDDLSRDDLEFT